VRAGLRLGIVERMRAEGCSGVTFILRKVIMALGLLPAAGVTGTVVVVEVVTGKVATVVTELGPVVVAKGGEVVVVGVVVGAAVAGVVEEAVAVVGVAAVVRVIRVVVVVGVAVGVVEICAAVFDVGGAVVVNAVKVVGAVAMNEEPKLNEGGPRPLSRRHCLSQHSSECCSQETLPHLQPLQASFPHGRR
jgi:hypothetical protein